MSRDDPTVRAAIALGLPVFPCAADKRPTCPHGFNDATRDPDKVQELFDKHPGPLIGVPMGEASGLFLLDIDSGFGKEHATSARDWFADNHERLPETLENDTQSGGKHLFYLHQPGLRNTASEIALGIDTKTSGGYAIWHPASGLRSNGKTPTPLPDWLAEAIREKPRTEHKPNGSTPPPNADQRVRKYCRAALDNERADLAAEREGTRNDALNKAAFNLAGLHHYGHFTEAEARAALHAACERNGLIADDGQAQFEKTYASGWNAGLVDPRTIPDQEPGAERASEQFREAGGDSSSNSEAQGKPHTFEVKAWAYRNPTTIPPRPWLYGTLLIRGEVTVGGASAGRGKTATFLNMMLSSTSGKALLGVNTYNRPLRWLYIHLEEPDVEFERRIAAAITHHNLDDETVAFLAGRIFHRSEGLTIAREVSSSTIVREPIREAILAVICELGIDVVVVDPVIASYKGTENSNEVQNAVARIWKDDVAVPGNCAILLSHHFRKGDAEPGNPDAIRGGGALVGVARCAFTLTPMTEADAARFGIPESERRAYIRLDDAKANMAPPQFATWFHLASVRLGNGNAEYPDGDNVHAIERWIPPDAFDGISPALAAAIIDRIDAGLEDGERYTSSRNSEERWAGHVIAEMADKDENAATRILNQWLNTQVLISKEYRSPEQRKPRKGLYANPLNRPGAA